jgi:hypothetical protein
MSTIKTEVDEVIINLENGKRAATRLIVSQDLDADLTSLVDLFAACKPGYLPTTGTIQTAVNQLFDKAAESLASLQQKEVEVEEGPMSKVAHHIRRQDILHEVFYELASRIRWPHHLAAIKQAVEETPAYRANEFSWKDVYVLIRERSTTISWRMPQPITCEADLATHVPDLLHRFLCATCVQIRKHDMFTNETWPTVEVRVSCEKKTIDDVGPSTKEAQSYWVVPRRLLEHHANRSLLAFPHIFTPSFDSMPIYYLIEALMHPELPWEDAIRIWEASKQARGSTPSTTNASTSTTTNTTNTTSTGRKRTLAEHQGSTPACEMARALLEINNVDAMAPYVDDVLRKYADYLLLDDFITLILWVRMVPCLVTFLPFVKGRFASLECHKVPFVAGAEELVAQQCKAILQSSLEEAAANAQAAIFMKLPTPAAQSAQASSSALASSSVQASSSAQASSLAQASSSSKLQQRYTEIDPSMYKQWVMGDRNSNDIMLQKPIIDHAARNGIPIRPAVTDIIDMSDDNGPVVHATVASHMFIAKSVEMFGQKYTVFEPRDGYPPKSDKPNRPWRRFAKEHFRLLMANRPSFVTQEQVDVLMTCLQDS